MDDENDSARYNLVVNLISYIAKSSQKLGELDFESSSDYLSRGTFIYQRSPSRAVPGDVYF